VKLAFCDIESVRLSARNGSALWEAAILLREDGKPADARDDAVYLWQVRPDLEHAEAGSLRIARYYERCKVADKPAGSGIQLIHPKLAKGKQQTHAAHLIARDIAHLLDGALIVGANPWFDAEHLDAFLREYGQALAADYHARDIGSVVHGYFAGQSRVVRNAQHNGGLELWEVPEVPLALKLNDVARAVGFNPDSYDSHTALDDARLVRDLWNAVMA
jgi:hypothetical protein